MKQANFCIFLIFVLSTLIYAEQATDIIRHDSLPKLQYLTSLSDSTKIDSGKIITSDSAEILSPPLRILLTGLKTTFEIIPKCTVDSVVLYVQYSESETDTLFKGTQPPFKTVWNFTKVSDQDQIHLQFGYMLYHTNGIIIISPALPHQWAIDRNKRHSRKKYSCKQILPPDSIIIDGKLPEWKRSRWGTAGACRFAFRWTSKELYFAAQVKTHDISQPNGIELHLDPNQTGYSFAAREHRSIRFNPRGRTFCFVCDYNDSLSRFTQNDSIAALLLDHLRWNTTLTDTGYIIEAALPFFGLSDRDFPKLKSGFDISVRQGNHFYNWAHKGSFNRYNPSEWGTLILRQAMLPLKIFMFAATAFIGIICLIITFLVIRHYIQNERFEREDCKGGSEQLNHLQDVLAQHYSDTSLTLDTFAKLTNLSSEMISSVLATELACDFDRFLTFKRVGSAKLQLWNFSKTIDEVAASCGFRNSEELSDHFRRYYHTDPESFRELIRDMADEEDSSDISDS